MCSLRISMLALLAVAAVLSACTSNSSGTNPGTTPSDKFGFRVGDYSVYQNTQLDSLNRPVTSGANVIPPYRSTRTVLRTGLSIGGQNDAVLVVDSSFIPTTGLPMGVTGGTRVDTTYYRVANDEVFAYFDTQRALSAAGGLASSGSAVKGLRAAWYKVAELRDTPGTEFSSNFMFTVDVPPLTDIPFNLTLAGRNQGVTMVSVNNMMYRVHRQQSTIRSNINIPLVGMIAFQIPGETDFGIPAATGTPRTVVRTQVNSTSFTVPLLGTQAIPGSVATLVSFRPGQ